MVDLHVLCKYRLLVKEFKVIIYLKHLFLWRGIQLNIEKRSKLNKKKMS